jgi:hypothetical protein
VCENNTRKGQEKKSCTSIVLARIVVMTFQTVEKTYTHLRESVAGFSHARLQHKPPIATHPQQRMVLCVVRN